MTKIKLSATQQTILHILQTNNKAMSAYDLLKLVKPYGFHAPTQIYRILNKLINYRLVIKIETLNRYLAYGHKFQQTYQILAICTDCQKVECIEMPNLDQIIEQSIYTKNFNSKYRHLEILGQCALCSSLKSNLA